MLDRSSLVNIYSPNFFNKLKDSKVNELYLYYINDLLEIAISKNDTEMSKYLLDLEINFTVEVKYLLGSVTSCLPYSTPLGQVLPVTFKSSSTVK
jgi:hypothetical protein